MICGTPKRPHEKNLNNSNAADDLNMNRRDKCLQIIDALSFFKRDFTKGWHCVYEADNKIQNMKGTHRNESSTSFRIWVFMAYCCAPTALVPSLD